MEPDVTPEAALHQFFEGFGIPALAESSVPSDQPYPYLTYQLVLGEWSGGEVNVPVNLWYRTESEAQPNAKVREMREAIGEGGTTVRCDGGILWVKRGDPWAQAVNIESGDDKVKRRLINVSVEYLIP
jgi:hypothetical protein